jgi:hypothetical protein
MRTSTLLLLGLFPALGYGQNLLPNGNFDQGATNLDGWEAFANFEATDGTPLSSGWGLADAPVVAPGDGTAVFGMNDQLATDDPFWAGATQQMNFQANLWTPDNNAGVTPTVDLYGQTVTFSGNAVVTEAYAAGNTAEAFIQFLDQGYAQTFIETVDVTGLPSGGAFEVSALVPSGAALNIVQVGFINSGIEGTAGEMTVSNLSVTAVPEPSLMAAVAGLAGLGVVFMRRRLRKR